MCKPLLFMIYNEIAQQVMSTVQAQQHLALTIDGWSRKQGEHHLITYMACSYGFTYYIDHKLCTSATAENLKSYTLEVLEKHKLRDKFVGLVTDTPSANKAFWRLLEDEMAGRCVIITGCFAHRLNLYCSDIGWVLLSCSAWGAFAGKGLL